MKIMLDCDGVIVDFIRGVEQLYGKVNWIPGEYRIHKVYGMSFHEFWKNIDDDFILHLEYTREHFDIMRILRGMDVTILTAPVAKGIYGRYLWIKKYLPGFYRNRKYLIGPDKSACANPDSLLIDDSDKNCEDFRKAGGNAILVPRMWNQDHELSEMSFKILEMRLSEIL